MAIIPPNNGKSCESNQTPDWLDPIKDELLKDGIIESGQNVGICLTYKDMKVNSNKLSTKLHKKYKSLYEDLTGEDVDEDNNISMSFTADGVTENYFGSDNEDAEDNSRYPSFYSAAFVDLINEGYIKLGKPVKISFTNKELKINGKKLGSEIRDRFMESARINSNNASMPEFSIQFVGKINKVNKTNVELDGSLTTSFNID